MQTEFLPTEEEEYQIGKLTEIVLAKAGYHRYEISNYARSGYECHHNIGYWKRAEYLGMGLGAASLLDNIRYSNTRDLYEYIEKSKDIRIQNFTCTLSHGREEMVQGISLHAGADIVERFGQMEEFMFLGFRMLDGISRDEFEQAFGVSIESVYGNVLTQLQQDDLIVKKGGRIYLTEKGMDLNNYVVSQFMLSE